MRESILHILGFGLLVACHPPILAAEPNAASLLSNGDFQADTDAKGIPEGWGEPKNGIEYATQGDNRFLRLASTKPGEMVMTYRRIRIPADVSALEMSWKQRTADLKRGKESWFDARIMLQWKNAREEKIDGGLPTCNTQQNSEEWLEKRVRFLVPKEAVFLELMPTLFQVASGTFDLDDLVIQETDPVPVQAEAKAKADAAAAKLAKETEKRRQAAAKSAGSDGELIANGSFQSEGRSGAPDQWGALKDDLSWRTEGTNRFLRLVSSTPGKMVLFYRTIDLPAGTKALELKWKQRISDFKRGTENYFDARIMLEWHDAAGKKLSGSPSPAPANHDTDGWVERRKSFLVPEEALTLVLMPALFRVESGTFDLDDLSLKPVDPAPLIAAEAAKIALEKAAQVEPETPKKANWPLELHVVKNKVFDAQDREIRLTGVNIDSLQWNARGENVLRSTIVAVEEWKANLLRLPVQEKFWFGKDASQSDGGRSYRELIEQVINLAANRGAYVMLDLHRFRAPRRIHIDFWKDVASKYKNHPAVLFELFNEPHGTSWEVWRNGGFVADKNATADEDAFLTPEEKSLNAQGFHAVGIQALLDAVRGTGAKNVVIAGGLDWAYDLSGIAEGYALDEHDGNGLMYAAHIYAQKTNWKGKVLVVADKYPVIVSEVGANTKKFTFMSAESQEDAATWVPRVLGFIQQHNLHWTGFSFHPGSAPMLISDWKYTPTPEWGAPAKRALAGESFPAPDELR